jgi:hypothetical protein
MTNQERFGKPIEEALNTLQAAVFVDKDQTKLELNDVGNVLTYLHAVEESLELMVELNLMSLEKFKVVYASVVNKNAH